MNTIDWTIVLGSFYLAGGAMTLMFEWSTSTFARRAHAVNRGPLISLLIVTAWPAALCAELWLRMRSHAWRTAMVPMLINLAVFLGVLLWAILFCLLADRLADDYWHRALVTAGLTALSAVLAGRLLAR